MKKFIALGLALLCLLALCFGITWKERTPAVTMARKSAQAPVENPAETPAPTPEPEDTVSPVMMARLSSVEGEHQWAVHTFSDGRTYKNSSRAVKSASVINLFIMEYVFHRIHNVGDVNPSDTIGGKTIKELVHKMVAETDNEATNLLIDKFGMEAFNNYFRDKGYDSTNIQRKMVDYEAMASGKENYTSVDDCLAFLKKAYENQDKTLYSDMLYIMKLQKHTWKIPEKLPEGTVVANKTGELDGVENDVGIVFTDKGDYIVIFMSDHITDDEGTASAMAETSRDLFDHLTA